MPVGLPADFDLDKFKTEFSASIMKDFDTKLNSTVNGAVTRIEKLLEGKGGDPTKKDEPVPEKKDEPVLEAKTIAELNAQLNALNKVVKASQEKATQAEENQKKAEATAKEASRVSAFDKAIGDFQFATPKAKTQFRDAYLNKVVWDEQGNLIVSDDKGTPMDMGGFLKSEYDDSIHLQPATGRGGSGITPGSGTRQATGFVYREDMTPAEIAKLPADQRAAMNAQVAEAVMGAMAG